MLRRFALLALVAGVTVVHAQERLRDQIYLKLNGAAFTLDVFKPKTSNGAAVLWMVSGGWYSSHDQINPLLAAAFNDQGFTLIQVVHGAQPKYTIPEIIQQVRRAVRFSRLHAKEWGFDPNKMGVSGGSAGGHLSLMLAGTGNEAEEKPMDEVDKVSSALQAVAAYFPPTDFLNWGQPDRIPFKAPQMAVFLPAFGITADVSDEKAKELGLLLSPIRYITPKFPPALLIHGDKDTLVPLQQSQIFDEALGKAGINHKLIVIPNHGHDAQTVLAGLPQLLAWYREKLK